LTQIYADKTGNNFPQGQVLGLENRAFRGGQGIFVKSFLTTD
jgi:hypothetical protein